MSELSVIIPALNEAAALPRLLEQLAQQQGVALEVIVADGGSTDGSAELARAAGAQVVVTARGRGTQMNAAAARASAEHLLFLHADSGLPSLALLKGALAALRAAEASGGTRVAGHFPLRFARSQLGHDFFYRNMEEKTASNRRDTINGDQGALLSAAYFRELGGFDERLPFFEDQRLAARVFETGRWICLPGWLQTSARRFEAEGHYRRFTLMAIIMGMHASRADEFFRRAPKLYAAQGETGLLRLGPYLALVREVLIDAGWAGALGIVYRVGRYVRSHSWQIFFWLDVWLRPRLGPGRYPFLRFHDRVFRPFSDHALGNAITGIGVSVWFLVVLPLACAWLDRRR
jgi:rSAM/selenodomain-associated transferase 2